MDQFLYDAIAFAMHNIPLTMLIFALAIGLLRCTIAGKMRENMSTV